MFVIDSDNDGDDYTNPNDYAHAAYDDEKCEIVARVGRPHVSDLSDWQSCQERAGWSG